MLCKLFSDLYYKLGLSICVFYDWNMNYGFHYKKVPTKYVSSPDLCSGNDNKDGEAHVPLSTVGKKVPHEYK